MAERDDRLMEDDSLVEAILRSTKPKKKKKSKLRNYAEKSLEGISRGARKIHEAIDPAKYVDDVANLAVNSLPGAGLKTATESYASANEKRKTGDYLGMGVDYALGALDQVTDVLPGPPLSAMFLGVGARNAPLDKLDEAIRRTKDEPDLFGKPSEQGLNTKKAIIRDTGWDHNPVDDQWRFETDDSRAEIKEPFKKKFDSLNTVPGYNMAQNRAPFAPAPLFDPYFDHTPEMYRPPDRLRMKHVLDHPELYDNYPDMAELPIEELSKHPTHTRGGYQSGGEWNGNELEEQIAELSAPSSRQLKSVMLHEGQHAIQRKEDFGPGGGSKMFTLKDKATQAHMEELEKALEFSNKASVGGLNLKPHDFTSSGIPASYSTAKKIESIGHSVAGDDPVFEAWISTGRLPPEDLGKRLNMFDAIQANTPSGSYRKVSGEVEARNVQSRMDLTAEQRRGFHDQQMVDGLRYGQAMDPEGKWPLRNSGGKLEIGPNSPWTPEDTMDTPYNHQFLRVEGGIPARLVSGMPDDLRSILSRSEDIPDDIPGIGHNGGPSMEPNKPQKPRKLNVNGDYVGAPPGINTPEAEKALVDRVVERILDPRGDGAENFYDDFGNEIAAMAPGNEEARRYGMMVGETSPLSSVASNINKANTAYNQATLGNPTEVVGINGRNQSKRIDENMQAGTMARGPKANPFSHNVISNRFPQPEDPQQGVMDTWMGRTAGFPMDEMGGGLSKSHIDYLNTHIMPEAYARTGTNYKTGQARAWETERQMAGEAPIEPINRLLENTRSVTQMAAIPGPSTGASEKLLNAPIGVKDAYTDDMMGAMSDDEGRNLVAKSLGLTAPMEKGYGPWQGMLEPNRAFGIQTGVTGQGADRSLEPSSATLAEAMRHWNMLLLGQDASGLTTARPLSKGMDAKANVIGIETGQRLEGRDGYEAVFGWLEKNVGPDWPDKIVVQPSGNGVSFKDIGIGNRGLRDVSSRFAAENGGAPLRMMKGVDDQFDWIDWSKGEYKSLMKGTLENPRLRALVEPVVPQLAARLQNVHSGFARQLGFKTNTVIDKFRSILARDGIDGVVKAAKAGTLPALAPVLLIALIDEAGLMDQDSGSPTPGNQ